MGRRYKSAADSLCCAAETDATLSSGYMLINIKKKTLATQSDRDTHPRNNIWYKYTSYLFFITSFNHSIITANTDSEEHLFIPLLQRCP